MRASARFQHDCALARVLRWWMYAPCFFRFRIFELESLHIVCEACWKIFCSPAGTRLKFHVRRRSDVGYEVRACSWRPLEQWHTVRAAVPGHVPAKWRSLPPMNTRKMSLLACMHVRSAFCARLSQALGRVGLSRGDLPACHSIRPGC